MTGAALLSPIDEKSDERSTEGEDEDEAIDLRTRKRSLAESKTDAAPEAVPDRQKSPRCSLATVMEDVFETLDDDEAARKIEEAEKVREATMVEGPEKVGEAMMVEGPEKVEEATMVAGPKNVEATMVEGPEKVEEAMMVEEATMVAGPKIEEATMVERAEKVQVAMMTEEAEKVEETAMVDDAAKEFQAVEEAEKVEKPKKVVDGPEEQLALSSSIAPLIEAPVTGTCMLETAEHPVAARSPYSTISEDASIDVPAPAFLASSAETFAIPSSTPRSSYANIEEDASSVDDYAGENISGDSGGILPKRLPSRKSSLSALKDKVSRDREKVALKEEQLVLKKKLAELERLQSELDEENGEQKETAASISIPFVSTPAVAEKGIADQSPPNAAVLGVVVNTSNECLFDDEGDEDILNVRPIDHAMGCEESEDVLKSHHRPNSPDLNQSTASLNSTPNSPDLNQS